MTNTVTCRKSSSRISAPRPARRWHAALEPALEEHLWTIAVTRLLFGTSLSVQAPPNLRSDALIDLIRAGVNDWGGVSPVTPDHVNPEAPWPHLAVLAEETAAAGRQLTERLAIGPAYARAPARWVDAALVPAVLRLTDSLGLARDRCMVCGHCDGAAGGRRRVGPAAPAGVQRFTVDGLGARGGTDGGGTVRIRNRGVVRRGWTRPGRRARRSRPPACGIGRRHCHLRSESQHQLHEHLRLSLRLLRLRQGPRFARLARSRHTTSTSGRSLAARSRPHELAQRKFACRAAFTRGIPAKPTLASSKP